MDGLCGAGQMSRGANFVNAVTEYEKSLVSSPADISMGTPICTYCMSSHITNVDLLFKRELKVSSPAKAYII